MSIIRQGFSEENKLQEKLDFLELELEPEGKYIILIISIDDYASLFDRTSENERELTSFLFISICQELIDTHFHGYSFENSTGEYVCLLQLKTDEEKLFALITEIQSKLEDSLNIKVTIGIGREVHCLRAHEAVSQKLFLGKNRVIAIDSIGTYQPVIPVFDMDKWNKLVLATKTADRESALQLINSLFEELVISRSINISYCHNVCLQLLIIASGLLMDMEIIHNEDLMNVKNNWDNVFKLETIEDMSIFVMKYYDKACDLISEKRNKRSSNVVEKVKDIINRKYSTNLTIGSIAQEAYIASTYLCLVFRQETGETLNEYLTRVRIDKAKEILMDRNIKLYDVCFAVGYTDASYFTKIFKKTTGLTPSDFRDKYL
ncbi:MAG: Two component transcriptional regulator, AraC family [Candidatus Uhrbacteria bacterium GW2011_GWD2_52_7]|uniref:Two component transcriptional regulator, AraC family n=1 Tax=Candidatus Uhrbacteria bacterium GW2011_GWD2_52_7 TaxID=1618989 RepID=A0A0G1XCP7_9BACT|nr:MAG: Two component transcriptional regulator, AraC family [Candidatus Uhrbacteria bacterium GW2011_GWD2_52_7]